jgi:Tfp pilus assembly protein PilZ
MRRAPELDAEVIDEFELFEEVFFLDEVTDFTQEINLGKQIVNEPWIKVQSKQGRAGWVYGAGVHYYKKKHPGAD